MAELAELMRDYAELGRELKALVGPARGFAQLMRLEDGQYHYVSSADRADVCKTFVEWLTRIGVVNTRDHGEAPADARERLTLEGQCALLGHLLESQGHTLILFMFDFGDGGNLAWYSNAPDPRPVVQSFLTVATHT